MEKMERSVDARGEKRQKEQDNDSRSEEEDPNSGPWVEKDKPPGYLDTEVQEELQKGYVWATEEYLGGMGESECSRILSL